MRAEVDISGRIEETHHVSALALTNDISICVLISAREKRLVLETLKQRRPERAAKLHHVLVYSTLIFFTLREHYGLSQITIDYEYTGFDASIKEHILNLCAKHQVSFRGWIEFGNVRKKSPAHELATRVFHSKQAAHFIVTAEQISREFK